MKSKILIFFSVISFFFGCSKNNYQLQLIDGDDIIPPEPAFFHYFTIHGADADNDGVRDDFELYVNKSFSDPNYRRNQKYYAKIYNKFMKSTNPQEINELALEFINALVCNEVLSVAEPREGNDAGVKINRMLANNFWRVRHQDKQGRMVKSGVHSWGSGSLMTNLKFCKIEFVDLKTTLKPYLEKDYKYGMTPEEITEFEKLMGIYQEQSTRIDLQEKVLEDAEDLRQKIRNDYEQPNPSSKNLENYIQNKSEEVQRKFNISN